MSASRPGTPLPWHIVPYGDGDSPVICSDKAGEWRICFMATPGGSPSSWRAIQANARYILHTANTYPKAEALAEALRELESAESDYRFAHAYGGDNTAAWDVMRRAGDKARAALADWEAAQ